MTTLSKIQKQNMKNHHIFLVSLPLQSYINPNLRLAYKLTRAGARVTFVTTVNGLNNIKTRPSIHGLSYNSFSDGYDDDVPPVRSKPGYFDSCKRVGSISLKSLLQKEDQKVDLLIYCMCLPWVAEVAREIHVPSAFFFVQPAAAFAVTYHFFKTDGGIANTDIDFAGTLKLPGLPLLKFSEIQSFFLPTDVYYSVMAPIFQEHIQTLENHPNPIVLINTFDDLELQSIKPIPDHINIFTVGPLVSGETETPIVCDLLPDPDRDIYLRWLDSKPEKSVVYVSFGSLAQLRRPQKEEIFEGLIQSGHPFLWVIRNHGEEDEEMKDLAAEHGGLIVGWCSQVEVLKHVAIGCFVTHCGWNSLMESVVSGVAVVGLAQFADQRMNAKMAEEVWGIGVKAVADGGDVVGREELKRCLAVVMGGGERGEEMKRNCEKWKSTAMAAVEEEGSSYKNLKRFLERLQS